MPTAASHSAGARRVSLLRRGWPFDSSARELRARAKPAAGEPDSFGAGTFVHQRAEHEYSVYVPPRAKARPKLIVMLHGCGQDPVDFATGTGMNELAKAHNAIVLYPAQSKTANSHGCWNWFKPEHQQRGHGEPAWIAALTRHVARRFRVDGGRIFIAGLSAGGAMAATVASAYPRLYAACGVHSGLAAGSAFDVIGALVTMRDGAGEFALTRGKRLPTIVFHGAMDRTVHPSHAHRVIHAALGGHPLLKGIRSGAVERAASEVAKADPFTRTVYKDPKGVVLAEHWEMPGLAHAWSGGNPLGSHTEQKGPSASAEMLRFFDAGSRRSLLGRMLKT